MEIEKLQAELRSKIDNQLSALGTPLEALDTVTKDLEAEINKGEADRIQAEEILKLVQARLSDLKTEPSPAQLSQPKAASSPVAKPVVAPPEAKPAPKESPKPVSAAPVVRQEENRLPEPAAPSPAAQQRPESAPVSSVVSAGGRVNEVDKGKEALDNHPVVAFLKGKMKMLEVIPGRPVRYEELSHGFKDSLLDIIKSGVLHLSKEDAERAGKPKKLHMLTVGPALTESDKAMLMCLIPTTTNDGAPQGANLVVPEQYRLYYYRSTLKQNYHDRSRVPGGLTTFLFSLPDGSILDWKLKGQSTSNPVSFHVHHRDTNKYNSPEYIHRPIPISEEILGITLSGLSSVEPVRDTDSSEPEHRVREIVVMKPVYSTEYADMEKTGHHNRDKSSVASVFKALEKLRNIWVYTSLEDLTITFTAEVTSSLKDQKEKLSLGEYKGYLPHMVFLGDDAEEVAKQFLVENKRKDERVYLRARVEGHTDKQAFPAFSGNSSILTYPYQLQVGFGGDRFGKKTLIPAPPKNSERYA